MEAIKLALLAALMGLLYILLMPLVAVVAVPVLLSLFCLKRLPVSLRQMRLV